MKTTSVLVGSALLMSASVMAHSSNVSVMNCQGGSTCSGPTQSGPTVKLAPTLSVPPPVKRRQLNPVPRGLMGLFSRDPELAIALAERNGNAAELTVNQLVAAIHAHNIPPNILEASKARGWSPPASKRSLIEARSELTARAGGGHTIPGKHGDPIPTEHVASFIQSGGSFPDKILAALKDVGWVQGGKGGAKSAKGASAGGAGGAKVKKGKKGKRDLGEFYERDVYDFYARDNTPVTAQMVNDIAKAMKSNPNAEEAVLAAFNSDLDVAAATVQLAKQWGGKKASLSAREAEADPEAWGYEGMNM